MKHIKDYKLFETSFKERESSIPLNDDQIRFRNDIMDVFMDIKDKWCIEYLDPDLHDPITYWLRFTENSILFYINGINNLELLFDIQNFIKRLQKMGFQIDPPSIDPNLMDKQRWLNFRIINI